MSSFSAKIDLSYAFGLIDQKTQSDLNIIRRIRNQFAHSVSLVNFASPEIQAVFNQLDTSVANQSDYPKRYLDRLRQIEQKIGSAMEVGDSVPGSSESQ